MKKPHSTRSNQKPPSAKKPKASTQEIIDILEDMANLLEIVGANPFKIRAFGNAARELDSLPTDLPDMVASGDLLEVPGIGKGIYGHIQEILETGTFTEFEELRNKVPPGLLDMLKIPGMGPKKVKTLHDKLGISTIAELEQAAQDDLISHLPGFGQRSQERILSGIQRIRNYSKRHLLSIVTKEADTIYRDICKHSDVDRALIAGSLRRSRETVKDIDILVSAKRPDRIMNDFTALTSVDSVSAKGDTKSSVVLKSGINVDLRVVSDEEFPFASLYFTGSKQHNTDMRGRAKKLGYKLNEYGLYKNDHPTPCKNEEEVFRKLGLDFIPPELRESMGEIQAAENHTLPELVTQQDIRGLFHVHTTYSDGTGTINDMAQGAKKLGLQYLGVSDHSQTAVYAGGLSPAKVKEQAAEVAAITESLKGFTVFHGIESDILPDGSLDYEDDILAMFDFVIASVHSVFNLSEAEMTSRIIRAIENPYTTMLGHPTGRVLLTREGYKVYINGIIEACAAHDVIIEINSHPSRLDLDWRHLKSAREKGVRIAIGPDSHTVKGMEDFRFGVGVARKGWLTADDVINTYSADRIRQLFRSSREG
ncbi:MAG: DNA polymerase/3'-5' exonuclease PolX [Candidatus Krumholzibacteria bacterium]|nr:DNA polymerase/3'-5' exonuclease PolX [Candidatus Krumholzibacteria bacterium]